MIRHIEFSIDFDLTCWGEDEEDFEGDTPEMIREEVIDWIINESAELLEGLKINKVWYEQEEE